MHNDKESPFTLTLTELGLSFPVRQFSGHEALNQVYRFEVEMLGPIPAMALEHLLHQPAWLEMSRDTGLHGIVHSAGLHYEGAQQIGYNLKLAPRLQTLEQQPRRRVFRQLSVPRLLRQLLNEHRLPGDSYRFELPNGEYPQREFCIQYDETDLHLLHRLCEEEGLHFHFEHHPDRHVLVFAEDSTSFALPPVETTFHLAAHSADPSQITQLSECHDRPFGEPQAGFQPRADNLGVLPTPADAANQAPLDTPSAPGRIDPLLTRRNQLGRRALERTRCRQRRVQGHSTQPELRSGRTLQVSGHPVAALNDQWLLCDVHHVGQQPGVDSPWPEQPTGYGNQFTAIPWATEFRPALTHPKPCISGYQVGCVMGPAGKPAALDAQGRIEVCLWPQPSGGPGAGGIWLSLVHTGSGQPRLPLGGNEVQVAFLDADPDRPVLLGDFTGAAPDESAQKIEDQPISLSANGNVLHLTPTAITLSGPMISPAQPSSAPPAACEHVDDTDRLAEHATGWSGELYLFEQPPSTARRLADTIWYIVRTPRPGLKELDGLNRDAVIMEGRSQASGNLSLTTKQKRQLAHEYARTPEQLCLLYPGQCVALADYFQQYWTSEQRLDFIDSAKAAKAHQRGVDNQLLFDWLVNRPGH
ncbi:hypothetical protein D3C84_318090 [compost metagenome]